MNELMNRWMGGWIDRQIDNVLMNGIDSVWTDEWIDRQIDGHMMDGQMDI